MSPGKWNIPNQYKGDSFDRINFAVFTTNSDSGSETDLTGVVPKMQIRKDSAAGRLVKTLTITDGLEWTAQASGTFYLDPFLITFDSGDYVYDLQFTYADTSVVTYLKGGFELIDDVTAA